MSAPAAPKRVRLESVDIVRGIIMIVMALDHTRDFFGDVTSSPTNLTTTTVALFFTRWITHFCAPVFFLLTGTGAFLSLKRKSTAELSRFLWTRGLWLIVLDFTVVRCLGLQFNFDYRVTVWNVLWGLGWAMLALAALVRLPAWAVGAFGVVMIATHNLLDGLTAPDVGALTPFINALHAPALLVAGPRFTILAAYPLIPWIGVTAVGFALGQVFSWEAERRKTFLVRLGVALTVAFVVLRAINVYGDPVPWSAQASPAFTLVSFLNLNKYPPSLLFLLMTLGPALLLLRAVDDNTSGWLRPALVFGKVPLFFFVLHLTLIHLLAVVACLVRYGAVHWMFESPSLDHFPITQPPGWPSSLPVVYLVWVVVVVALYPACRWFAALKQRRTDWWLSYL